MSTDAKKEKIWLEIFLVYFKPNPARFRHMKTANVCKKEVQQV